MDIENDGMSIFDFLIPISFYAISPSKKDLLHHIIKLIERFDRLSGIAAAQGRGWELFSDDVIQRNRTSAPFIDILLGPRKDLRGGTKKVGRGDKHESRSLLRNADGFFSARGLLAHDREHDAVQNTMR